MEAVKAPLAPVVEKCEHASSDPWWCVTHESKWDLEKRCYAAKAQGAK